MNRFIRFEAKTRRFYCCDEVVSVKVLGAMLAYALLHGKKVRLPFCERDRYGSRHKRSMWSVEVSTGYVQQMLEFVAQNGWFWDEVPEFQSRQDSDHDFDPENITPSLNWRVVTEMRRGVEHLLQQARRLEVTLDWNENRRIRGRLVEEVAARRGRADTLTAQAADLLAAGVPPR